MAALSKAEPSADVGSRGLSHELGTSRISASASGFAFAVFFAARNVR